MKSLQLVYPSKKTLLNGVAYLQIGVQRPHNIPITEISAYSSFKTIIRINNETYTITDKEILEFGDVYFRKSSSENFEIEILDVNNPYLIVDLIYEIAD